MTLAPRRVILTATALLLAAAPSLAQSPGNPAAVTPGSADDYRYERQVRPAGPGANRLAIDLPLLAGASPFSVVTRLAGADGESVAVAQGGLADLRFYDGDNREIPYLLVQPPPRTREWAIGRVLQVAPTKKNSGFELDLGKAQAVDRLALAGLPVPYLKRARLEASGDRAHWTMLVDETTVFDLPDEKLRREEIEFPAGEYRYLRLTWDDSNSARLPPPRGARARLAGAAAPPATLRAPLSFERRASEPGVSRYRVSLPAPRLPIVAVELSVSGGYVLRQARLAESRLAGAEMRAVPLGNATLRRAVRDDMAAAELRIPIAAPQESQLELVVEDGSNRPLDLTGVTAVFAELPWIYFETASEAVMLARYGSRGATPPRYDLEAARPSIGRGAVPLATWGEPLDIRPSVAVAQAAAFPVVGASLDTSAFAYRRAIPPGRRGLTALRLDAAALAHSRFSDLRIVTPDSRQVAYLVERLDEPLGIDLQKPQPAEAMPGAPAALRGEPGAAALTAYRLSLPQPGLPAARLVLETSASVFARQVRVLVERRDEGGRDGRRLDVVAESAWKHTEPETPAPPLTLALPPGLPGALWLVVDEGDNSRLPLARARLLLPATQLRFFRGTDEPLSLIYGNADAAVPRYDLALLAPRLVGAAAFEVWPGPENGAAEGGQHGATATRLFWGALVAAVVVLLVVLARLLKA